MHNQQTNGMQQLINHYYRMWPSNDQMCWDAAMIICMCIGIGIIYHFFFLLWIINSIPHVYTVLHTIMLCAPIILILIWIVINKQILLVLAGFLFCLIGKRTTTKKPIALFRWLWTLKLLSVGLLPESQFQFWNEIEWIWNFYLVQTAPNTKFHGPIIDNCMIIIVGLFGNLIRAWLCTNHYRCPKLPDFLIGKKFSRKKGLKWWNAQITPLPWTLLIEIVRFQP